MLISLCIRHCRVHNFVNGLDLVPRILGRSLVVSSSLKNLITGFPGRISKMLLSDLTGAEAFVPFGVFHLLRDAQLQSFDSRTQPQVLEVGFTHIRSTPGVPILRLNHFVSDHSLETYKANLAEYMAQARAVLLQGGRLSSDYDLDIVRPGMPPAMTRCWRMPDPEMFRCSDLN